MLADSRSDQSKRTELTVFAVASVFCFKKKKTTLETSVLVEAKSVHTDTESSLYQCSSRFDSVSQKSISQYFLFISALIDHTRSHCSRCTLSFMLGQLVLPLKNMFSTCSSATATLRDHSEAF